MKLKSLIYLVNDITNSLLEKDRDNRTRQIANLKFALISVIVLLMISLAFNIYHIIK